jgi:hypothetical protein
MGAGGIQRVAAFSARLSGQHPDSLHDSDSKFKFITLDVHKPTAFTAAHSLLGPPQGRCIHWAAAFTRPDSRPAHDVDGCLPAPGSPGPSRRCAAECGAAIRAGSSLPRPPVRVLRVSWPAWMLGASLPCLWMQGRHTSALPSPVRASAAPWS